jgi:hypothetical protein
MTRPSRRGAGLSGRPSSPGTGVSLRRSWFQHALPVCATARSLLCSYSEAYRESVSSRASAGQSVTGRRAALRSLARIGSAEMAG